MRVSTSRRVADSGFYVDSRSTAGSTEPGRRRHRARNYLAKNCPRRRPRDGLVAEAALAVARHHLVFPRRRAGAAGPGRWGRMGEAGWKSKFYGAFVLNHRVVLHAIDATPARWRGDAGSSPLDRARTAASSPRNDLVKNCRVHPTHWLISTAGCPKRRESCTLLLEASEESVGFIWGRIVRVPLASIR